MLLILHIERAAIIKPYVMKFASSILNIFQLLFLDHKMDLHYAKLDIFDRIWTDDVVCI